MSGVADNRRVVAIRDNQTGLRGKIPLLFKQSRELRRNRPEESIAKVEIVEPFAVAEQIGPGDLDLDDRQPALGVDRHQIGAPPIGQGHFAYCEKVLPTEQASDSPCDLGRDRRSVGET